MSNEHLLISTPEVARSAQALDLHYQCRSDDATGNQKTGEPWKSLSETNRLRLFERMEDTQIPVGFDVSFSFWMNINAASDVTHDLDVELDRTAFEGLDAIAALLDG